MPIFAVNAWRAFDRRSADRLLSGTPISFIHLLSYTSACVNPIIYCFMNKRFRQGILSTFACCRCPCRRGGGALERGGLGGGMGRGGRWGLGGKAGGSRSGAENGQVPPSAGSTRFTYSSVRGSAQA